MGKPIVLAYSGGLDTSVILTWLKEEYNVEVVAYAADVGQHDDFDAIRDKANRTGASSVYIEDLKEEFVADYVWPMLRSGARYEDQYLLGTSIARPIIAKRQVEIAKEVGADSVSHGATGKGNDQIRFELTFAALAPELKVIAPWRTWDLLTRDKLFDYADTHNIELPITRDKPYSIDQNMLHTSYEGGVLEDPTNAPDEAMFLTTVSPQNAPDQATEVTVEFENGDPISLNGQRLSPADLLVAANKIAGANGVGRADIIENRFVGMKSRGVYETPGGTLLHFARRAVEQLTLDREAMYLRDRLMPDYAKMVYNGFWFAPERLMLQALVDEAAKVVNGTVTVSLYKGTMTLISRLSEKALYSQSIASFDGVDDYDQADAGGFIRLQGLRLRVPRARS